MDQSKKSKDELKKCCPNCGKGWDGIDCTHCGFDAYSFDPRYDLG